MFISVKNTKMRKISKVASIGYAVMYNVAMTAFLIIALLSFTGHSAVTKAKMLWAFIPVAVLIAVKTVMDIACSKSSEGGCTMAVCKLILKGLVMFSIGLGIKKLKDKSGSLTWAGIVIPLWIIIAVLGGCTLIAVLLFVTRMGVALKQRQCLTNDIGVSTWATTNLIFIFGLGVYLLLKGAAFGDGKAKIEIFLPACYASIAFGVTMILCMALCHSSL
jgi:hypothetical protein